MTSMLLNDVTALDPHTEWCPGKCYCGSPCCKNNPHNGAHRCFTHD